MAATIEEETTSLICQSTSATLLPAEFNLYHFIGNVFAGKQHVPVHPSSTRTLRKAQTRRADTRMIDDKYKNKTFNAMIEHCNATPTFLDIVSMYDANVATTYFITEKSTSFLGILCRGAFKPRRKS